MLQSLFTPWNLKFFFATLANDILMVNYILMPKPFNQISTVLLQ